LFLFLGFVIGRFSPTAMEVNLGASAQAAPSSSSVSQMAKGKKLPSRARLKSSVVEKTQAMVGKRGCRRQPQHEKSAPLFARSPTSSSSSSLPPSVHPKDAFLSVIKTVEMFKVVSFHWLPFPLNMFGVHAPKDPDSLNLGISAQYPTVSFF
jgi:hypothetical protein